MASSSPATQPLLPSSAPQPQPQTTNLNQLRSQWAYAQRAYPLGYVPGDARERALQSIQRSQAIQKPIRPLTTAVEEFAETRAPLFEGGES